MGTTITSAPTKRKPKSTATRLKTLLRALADLQDEGLHERSMLILTMICERDPEDATPGAFARELDVIPSVVRRYTQPLAEHGYIKRHAGVAADQRIVTYEPTASGRALAEKIARMVHGKPEAGE